MGKRSVAIRWPFGMVRWMSVSSREMFHWIISENVDCDVWLKIREQRNGQWFCCALSETLKSFSSRKKRKKNRNFLQMQIGGEQSRQWRNASFVEFLCGPGNGNTRDRWVPSKRDIFIKSRIRRRGSAEESNFDLFNVITLQNLKQFYVSANHA